MQEKIKLEVGLRGYFLYAESTDYWSPVAKKAEIISIQNDRVIIKTEDGEIMKMKQGDCFNPFMSQNYPVRQLRLF